MSSTAKTDHATAAILELSKSIRLLCKADPGQRNEAILTGMVEEMKVLTTCLREGTFRRLEGFGSALAKLIGNFVKEPNQVSLSPLRTMTHAIDFLRTAIASGMSFDQLAKTPLNVLTLDDDPVCLKALMMSLKSSAIAPKSCESVKSALALLELSNFDVIFSDIMMPEMDGLTFCSEVRKLPKNKETPLIFVTALTDFATRSRSKLSGGCDFVAKPFVPSEILLKAFTFGLRYRMAQAKNPANRQEILALKGVACLDELGKVKSINEEGARLLGHLPTEVIGWDLDVLFPAELQYCENLEAMRSVLVGQSKLNQPINIIGRRKDGTRTPLILRFGEQRTDNRRTLICIFRSDHQEPNSSTAAASADAPCSGEPFSDEPAGPNDGASLENGDGVAAITDPPAPARLPLAPDPTETTGPTPETPVTGAAETVSPSPVQAGPDPEGTSADVALPESARNASEPARLSHSNGSRNQSSRETGPNDIPSSGDAEAALEANLRNTLAALEQTVARQREQLAHAESQLFNQGARQEELDRNLSAAAGVEAGLREELLKQRDVQEELRREIKQLEEKRAELQGAAEQLTTERTNLETTTRELAAATAALQAATERANEFQAGSDRTKQELAALKQSLKQSGAQLAAETDRRATAEARALDLGRQQTELEQTAAERQKSQTKTQGDLKEIQAQLQATAEALYTERNNLEHKNRELTVAQAALQSTASRESELGNQCAQLEESLAELRESLKRKSEQLVAEAERRSAAEEQAVQYAQTREHLEQALVQRTDSEDKIRRELQTQRAQLQKAVDDLAAARSKLDAKAQDLASAQAALQAKSSLEGQWQGGHVRLRQEVASLQDLLKETQAQLATETDRRSTAEKQAADLGHVQAELEQLLAEREKANARLSTELEEQQTQLQGAMADCTTEQRKLKAKSQELSVAQAALQAATKRESQLRNDATILEQTLAELQESSKQAQAQQAMATATRSEAEAKLAAAVQAQTELEQTLLERTEAAQALRSELEAKQVQLQDQLAAERNKLRESTVELAATKAALQAGTAREEGLQAENGHWQQELAAETERRLAADRQAAESARLRNELEQALAQGKAAEEKLLQELDAVRTQLQGTNESLGAERGKLEAKAQELIAIQCAKDESEILSQRERARIEQTLVATRQALEQVRKQLSAESERRAAAETQAGQSTRLRAELDQVLVQGKARDEKLQVELEQKTALLHTACASLEAERGKLKTKTQELVAVRAESAEREFQQKGERAKLEQALATAGQSVEQLRKQLSAESERCAAAEQQALESVRLRTELEQALTQGKAAEEKLRADLEQKAAQLQASGQSLEAERGKLKAKTQELATAQAANAKHEFQLRGERAKAEQALAAARQSLEQVQKQVAVESERRTALETQAAELTRARDEMQQSLVQAKGAEEQMRKDLEQRTAQLEVFAQSLEAERGNLKARTQELATAQTAYAERETQLKEERTKVENALTAAEQSAAQVQQQLAAEAQRRAALETQAAELTRVRAEQEQALVQGKAAAEKLRSELEKQAAELQATRQSLAAERGNLKARTQQLATAQTAYAERETQLKGERAKVDKALAAAEQSLAQVQKQLAVESERRAALETQAAELTQVRSEQEQNLAKSKAAEERLRAALQQKGAQLQATGRSLEAERGKLKARTQEFAAAQAAHAERETQLKEQQIGVEKALAAAEQSLAQVQKQLAVESERRTALERQAAELTRVRSEQEQFLAQSKAAEEKLRVALEQRAAELQAAGQRLEAERTNLTAKTEELAGAQAANAERETQLKGECAKVQEALAAAEQSLAQVRQQLAVETERRAAVETNAADLTQVQAELKQVVAEGTRAQEKLRAEVETMRTQLRATGQSLEAERNKLKARTEELNAVQTANAEREIRLKAERTKAEQALAALEQSLAQTQKQLAVESAGRGAAETQAAELTRLRAELEEAVVQHTDLAAQLWDELDGQRGQLRAMQRELAAERRNFEAKTKELLSAQALLLAGAERARQLEAGLAQKEQSLEQTNTQLLAETDRRAAAEGQATDLTRLRTELEHALAERKDAEAKLRSELEDQKAQFQAALDHLAAERTKLKARSEELASAQAAMQAGLARERQLGAERAQLQEALGASEESLNHGLTEIRLVRETNRSLEGKLAELASAHEALNATLSTTRNRLQEEEPQRHRLAAMVLEEQAAKTEFQNRLESLCESDKTLRHQVDSMEAELRQRASALQRLESILEAEGRERRHLADHIQQVEAKLGETSRQLALKTAAEQDWQRREAGLESSLSRLQEVVTNSNALLTIRETEIRKAKENINELTVVQSTLCAKLREQAAKELSLLEYRAEISKELEIAQKQIEDGQRNLAALRDAAAEASEFMSAIGRQHLQQIRSRLNTPPPEVFSEIAESI